MSAKERIQKIEENISKVKGATYAWVETSISCAVPSMVIDLEQRIRAFGPECVKNIRVEGTLIRYQVNDKCKAVIKSVIAGFVEGWIKGNSKK